MVKRILFGLILALVISAGSSIAANAGSYFEKGLQAAKDGHYSEAAKYYKKICNKRIQTLGGCNNLGLLYKNGQGVEQSYTTADKLFKKDCDGGDAMGCNNLGSSYYNGQGVELNKIKAYQYYMKAAKKGNTNAQYNLDILCKQSPWACQK